MLIKDPCNRITPQQALNHPWFDAAKEHIVVDPQAYDNAIIRLKGFNGASKLKRAAINIMVKQMAEEKHDKMRKVFQSIDKDHSGAIDKQELTDALNAKKITMNSEEIDRMMVSIDFSKDREINYTEFLAATVEPNILHDEKMVKGVFNLFDIDNDGQIEVKEMVQSFSKIGLNITGDEIREVMVLHDKDAGGSISLDEFKEML